MTESEDPWADHIRGAAPTPLEEGSDPLSLSPSPPTVQESSPKKDNVMRSVVQRTESDSLGAQWGLGSEEAVVAASAGTQGETGHQSSNAAPTANGAAVGSRTDTPKGVANAALGEVAMDEDEDEDEEEFIYPGGPSASSETEEAASQPRSSQSALEGIAPEEDTARRAGEKERQTPDTMEGRRQIGQSAQQAKPIDHSRLSQLCSQGPLSSLQSFFTVTTSPGPAGSDVSAFALANEPNPASGLVPIHFAAREGKLDIAKWLIKDAGALVEMEDREGETALHKASLAGKLPVLTYLLSSGAEANCVDGDGWTPLHNACSRGYLDIVKVLVENDGASVDVKGGRGGWTPLMNASSHGHLPIVRYLIGKQHADPFVRNAAGETAYDVAAATFEIYICQILERYESERWAALRFALTSGDSSEDRETQRQMIPGQGPYNPLALHTTVPIVLHENQRLDTRLSTLTIRAGKPRWSGTQAGRPDKPDRRAPGTMPPGPLSLSRTRNIPMRRDDAKLPTRKEPYKVRLANRSTQIAAARRARGELTSDDLGTTPTPDSVMNSMGSSNSIETGEGQGRDAEEAHFWLSDWQTDLTHPQVDAEQGWQYSQSFDAPEERWLASPPPPLVRLLEGRGLGQSMQRAVTGVVLATSGGAAVEEAEAISTGWVRRRRWVRVMRRRLDIEFGDELEAAEQASLSLSASRSGSERGGALLTSAAVIEAQQAARSEAEKLGPAADYLERSSAMAGSSPAFTSDGAVTQSDSQLKTQITRLEVAVAELRSFAFTDHDTTRQGRAEEMLKQFTLQLGQLRQAAGLEESSDDEEEEDDDDEFIYPNSYKDDGQSVITRIGTPSVTTSGIVPPRQRSTPSEAGTSVGATRSADLANASEFRVPTNEVPNRSGHHAHHGLQEQNLLPSWENDGDVGQCRGCNRKFTFFLRKHHCRRCGRIYCDACSSHRALLSPNELVIDPGIPEMMLLESSGPTRICDGCDAERSLPSSLRNARGVEAMSGAVDRLNMERVDSAMSDASSRASELNECPVCGAVLAGLGESALQEEHVRMCLENGGGGSVQGSRYLIYKLAEGPIVGKECQICLEDLCVGMTIARLPCLCYYHRHCIDSWFSRGRTCPVHARSW